MFSLQNKIALVTGATGGIGEAIAKQLKEAGADVIVTGRNKDKLDSNFDNNFTKIISDLDLENSAIELIQTIIDKKNKIDILINNAGITKDTHLIRMNDEQFDSVINTNLKSCFRLSREASKYMIKNRYGRIINISSIIGIIGGKMQTNYAASKGGIIAMTKSIAAELGSRNITANCIAPGFIKTSMTDILPDDVKNFYLSQIPTGRFGEPIDIANACVFLASDEASYINGHTLHINGGMGRF